MTRRRDLLAVGGASLVGAAGLGAAAAVAPAEFPAAGSPGAAGPAGDGVVPFHGAHQAGVVTPAQDRLHFVAFDVLTKDRAELAELFRRWTQAAARMTAGLDAGPVGAGAGPPEAPPDDTGEAIGLPPARLTLTFGVGTSLFRDATGRDRFGIADRRPPAFADLPTFPRDALQPEISGGDLCVQACSDDPQVAVHAVRNLARIGMGTVAVRWSQLGFGRTSSTSRTQDTPRNLFGFKDGTRNLKAEDHALLEQHVWVAPGDGPDWLAGGSYLVIRKIRMLTESWDRTPLGEQEAIIGRAKGSGAPVGRTGEFDPVDFATHGPDGEPLLAMDAHVRLAHPDTNGGVRLLRRGYNYVDGSDGLGRLAAGLFFMAYQRDPRRQFVPVQARLARQDRLNEYIRHISSGLFACLPGAHDATDFLGSRLLG